MTNAKTTWSAIIGGCMLWGWAYMAYELGEYHGLRNAKKQITKTNIIRFKGERPNLRAVIDTTGRVYWEEQCADTVRVEVRCEPDCYTGAVECQEFVRPVRGAAQ